jgi:hypothetical protein
LLTKFQPTFDGILQIYRLFFPGDAHMIHYRPIFPAAVRICIASIAAFAQNATNTIVSRPVTLSSTETARFNIMSAGADFP